MEYFFTADHHFHHTNIINLCNRPFDNIEQMNSELIKKWNEKVTKADIVYYLGDFSWITHNQAIKNLLMALNYKEFHLLLGNHERSCLDKVTLTLFTTVSTHRDIKLFHQNMTLSHYPMKHWYREYHEAWNLHGHSHGKDSMPFLNQFDVGVDNTNYYPITFDEIKKTIEKKNKLIRRPI